MSEKVDKLKARLAGLGVTTGNEIAAPRSKRPAASAESAPPAPAETRGDTSASLIQDLRARLGGAGAPAPLPARDLDSAPPTPGDHEIDRVVRGKVEGGDEAGGFYLVRRDYPLDYAQGAVALGSALQSGAKEIAFSASDTELLAFDARRALFIDTETTGLAGGAGTVAFLVGVGYFHGDVFRLDQCFMRDYDDEAPMLAWLGELARDFDALVSYNGKSFDLPLIRTRFIQNRVPCRFEGLLHYDLVHAARRFWKRRLRDCSLGSIEREVLGVRRAGDVPSWMIPQLYFDYLDSRDARPLEAVFYHHRMDILSLAALTGWIARCLTAPEGFEHAEDRLSVVRMHFRQKAWAEVATQGLRFLEAREGEALRRECLEMVGLAHKRLGQWEAMCDAFERMLAEFPQDFTARVELAKLHEHRTRDLCTARRLCEEGLKYYYTQLSLARPAGLDEAGAAALQQRLARIKRKLGRAGDELEGL